MKQRKTLESETHLVEIDLLRGGAHALAANQSALRPGQHEGSQRRPALMPSKQPYRAEDKLRVTLAAVPDTHRVLLFFGAPPIDHINAETPLRAHAKARQLFGAKQPIHRCGMYPEILR